MKLWEQVGWHDGVDAGQEQSCKSFSIESTRIAMVPIEDVVPSNPSGPRHGYCYVGWSEDGTQWVPPRVLKIDAGLGV
jgi:hypothetical protein